MATRQEYLDNFLTNIRVYARRAEVKFRLTPEEIFQKLEDGGFNVTSRKTAMYPVLRQALLKKGVSQDQVHHAALIGAELLYELWYGGGLSNVHDRGYMVAGQLEVEDIWTSIDASVSTVVMDCNAARNREQLANKRSLPGLIKANLHRQVRRGENPDEAYM
jgi:hypothetical protein